MRKIIIVTKFLQRLMGQMFPPKFYPTALAPISTCKPCWELLSFFSFFFVKTAPIGHDRQGLVFFFFPWLLA